MEDFETERYQRLRLGEHALRLSLSTQVSLFDDIPILVVVSEFIREARGLYDIKRR